MWISARRVVMVYCLVALLMPVASGLTQSDKKHAIDDKMSAHMKAMHALKKRIPEEYRIMNRTPISPDDQSLTQGQQVFNQHCANCHGNNGRGDGPAAKGLSTLPANFLDLEHSAIYGPGEKFWIIGNGSSETGMPAFPQIGLRDRWNLVNYIYKLQGEKSLPHGNSHTH